jgi:hypothetical protein
MNRKTKYLIPTFAAVFALTFIFVTPYVIAEGDYEGHSKWGAKHHGMNKAVTVDGFTGFIPIPEDFNKETMKALKEQVSVTLIDAATAAEDNGLSNVMKASIGIVKNENGDKYVAWVLTGMSMEDDTVTKNIFVVDAGNAENTGSITKSFDLSNIEEMKSQWKDHESNFSGDHETMKEKFRESHGMEGEHLGTNT